MTFPCPALTRSDVMELINASVNLPAVFKPVAYIALNNMSDVEFAALGMKISDAVKLLQAGDKNGLVALLSSSGVPEPIINYVANSIAV